MAKLGELYRFAKIQTGKPKHDPIEVGVVLRVGAGKVLGQALEIPLHAGLLEADCPCGFACRADTSAGLTGLLEAHLG